MPQSFDDLARHLSEQTPNENRSLPAYLPIAPPGHQAAKPVISTTGANQRWEQLRDTLSRFNPLPKREPLHERERFSGDPRDDARLNWADQLPPWWHFDIDARQLDRETLWINEKLYEFFVQYLKPVWWDRFVEGINDFLTMIYKELIRPVWLFFAAPFLAIAELFKGIDWPWNFELRGAHLSVKQTPFRRIVFDNRISPDLVARLWADPDGFLEAGQRLKDCDRTTVARVPLRAPDRSGRIPVAETGVLKRFNLRGWAHTLSHLLWFTRAGRCWAYGRELLIGSAVTARPLAIVEDRIGPLRLRSFVLTEFIEGQPLTRFLNNTSLTTAELDQVASRFATIWQALGDHRLIHGDLKAGNFVVTPDHEIRLIDLDGTWRHWFDVTFLPSRDREWLRFIRNWRGQPAVAAAFRAAVARHIDERPARQIESSAPASLHLQRAA